MANFKTRPITMDEFKLINHTMRTGFVTNDGKTVRPNIPIAALLTAQINLGLRVGDMCRLKLSDFVYEHGDWRLSIVEEKTKKVRNFIVPIEVYTYLQRYALEQGRKPNDRLFPISVRAVQNHLKITCEHLGIKDVSSHSYRKAYAVKIFQDNDYNVELVRLLLNHSSIAVTQNYISVEPKVVRQALQKHIILPEE